MNIGTIAVELKYLNPYSNLITLKALIIAVFVGVSIAVIVSYTDKWYYGNFVRKILSMSALSEESALTLNELGYGKSSFIKRGLKKGSYLRKHGNIAIANEDEITTTVSYKSKLVSFFKGEKSRTVYDFDKALVYIPEKIKFSSEVRYEKKGTNPVLSVIYILITAGVCYALYIYLPKAVKIIDNLIDMLH